MKNTMNKTQEQINNDIENLEYEIASSNEMREYNGSD